MSPSRWHGGQHSACGSLAHKYKWRHTRKGTRTGRGIGRGIRAVVVERHGQCCRDYVPLRRSHNFVEFPAVITVLPWNLLGSADRSQISRERAHCVHRCDQSDTPPSGCLAGGAGRGTLGDGNGGGGGGSSAARGRSSYARTGL